MSLVLRKRRHTAQTRLDLQLEETVINVWKKIELPLFMSVKALAYDKRREKAEQKFQVFASIPSCT